MMKSNTNGYWVMVFAMAIFLASLCGMTADSFAACGEFRSGCLYQNQYIDSCNGKTRLVHQTDGNVVLYEIEGSALWSTRTAGKATSGFCMQGDGNLVLYDNQGKALWSSGTAGNPGAWLAIQEDCNLVIYNSSGKAIWWTGTKCKNPVPENNAEFVSQVVPTTMQVNQSYNVQVTMRNTGSATWTAYKNYRLGSQNPQDNTIWGIGRVFLSSSDNIAKGQTKTFAFSVKAPSVPGPYNFQWKMLREAVAWFGAKSTNVSVNVTQPTQSFNGTYRLTAKHSNKCLDVEGQWTHDGANVHQWSWWGGDNQKWYIEPLEGGFYRLMAMHSGKYLDVYGVSMESGANVHQWEWWGGDNQKWLIESTGDQYFSLKAKHSGKCLDVYGQGMNDGANVIQWDCLGQDNQKWRIEVVSIPNVDNVLRIIKDNNIYASTDKQKNRDLLREPLKILTLNEARILMNIIRFQNRTDDLINGLINIDPSVTDPNALKSEWHDILISGKLDYAIEILTYTLFKQIPGGGSKCDGNTVIVENYTGLDINTLIHESHHSFNFTHGISPGDINAYDEGIAITVIDYYHKYKDNRAHKNMAESIFGTELNYFQNIWPGVGIRIGNLNGSDEKGNLFVRFLMSEDQSTINWFDNALAIDVYNRFWFSLDRSEDDPGWWERWLQSVAIATQQTRDYLASLPH